MLVNIYMLLSLKLNFWMHAWTCICQLQVLNARSAISYSIKNTTLLTQKCDFINNNNKTRPILDIFWMFKCEQALWSFIKNPKFLHLDELQVRLLLYILHF